MTAGERIPWRFAPVPDEMLWDTTLPAEVLRVWAAIYRITDLQGIASIGQTELGRKLGWSESTIRRWVRKGEEAGYITTVRRGLGLPNEYKAVLPTLVSSDAPDRSEMTDQPAKNDRSGRSEMTDPSYTGERTTTEERTDGGASGTTPKVDGVKRRSGFPKDWMPGAAEKTAAEGAGMTPEQRRFEWEQFRDHHTAAGKTMVDWAAAWRTWCGNWKRYNAGPARSTPKTRQDAGLATLRKLHDEYRETGS